MTSPTDTSERTLLHGTSPLAAAAIAVEGFRLAPSSLRFWGAGALGQGIYLTRSLEWAREFMRDFGGTGRGVVLRVELAPGTRLLWLDGRFSATRIDALQREFGREILSPAFHQALPRNKHLRTTELIDLLNYLHAKDRVPMWQQRWRGMSGVRAQLRRAQYAGFGCATTGVGVVVFDPAALRLRAVLRSEAPDRLAPAAAAWVLAQAVEQLREREDWLYEDDGADRDDGLDRREREELAREDRLERAELARAERALVRYAREHGLPIPPGLAADG